MHDPKSLETFFTEYLPKTKEFVEQLWKTDRKELNAFLEEWLSTCVSDSWMRPYFRDMQYWTNVASHKYTNPWDVL